MDNWDMVLVFTNQDGGEGSIRTSHYTDYLSVIDRAIKTIEGMREHNSVFKSLYITREN